MIKEKIEKYLLYFLILVYVSGAIGFIINPNFFTPFTPFTLLLTCLVFLIYQPIQNSKYLIAFFAIAIIGFILEAIGVKTKLIFGDYFYGNALGFKFLNVPIIIPINWAILINAGALVATIFSKGRHSVALISASLITFIDFLIEQNAKALDFWYFDRGIAGIHNYLAWFIISYSLSLIFYNQITIGEKKVAATILILQTFFFSFLLFTNFLKFT